VHVDDRVLRPRHEVLGRDQHRCRFVFTDIGQRQCRRPPFGGTRPDLSRRRLLRGADCERDGGEADDERKPVADTHHEVPWETADKKGRLLAWEQPAVIVNRSKPVSRILFLRLDRRRPFGRRRSRSGR